jgi:4-hydroxyphenylpyruvate dioxygenase
MKATKPERTRAKAAPEAPDDFLKIRGTDHVEFYVGNAKQAAYYYAHAFGLTAVAYAGLETGLRDRASYVLQQGKVRLVLTAALGPDGPIGDHVQRHGDGVKDIALEVEDVDLAWEGTTSRGARSIQEPHDLKDEHGVVRHAAIATYGDTIHSLVDRSRYKGVYLPGYGATGAKAESGPLLYIDHMVGNVPLGDMDRYVAYYRDVMGFSQYQHFDDKDISTEYSALMSKVMAGGGGRIKFPINEPAEGKRKSQIEEYLDYYRGPGVQHIAIATADIIDTVARLRDSGVSFLTVPRAYYDMLPARVGTIDENIDTLAGLGILVDRDEEGYLLQLFTKPVEDRPTVFYEIIQRKGSRGFGKGNFKALFEAIEREQSLRGNL